MALRVDFTLPYEAYAWFKYVKRDAREALLVSSSASIDRCDKIEKWVSYARNLQLSYSFLFVVS